MIYNHKCHRCKEDFKSNKKWDAICPKCIAKCMEIAKDKSINISENSNKKQGSIFSKNKMKVTSNVETQVQDSYFDKKSLDSKIIKNNDEEQGENIIEMKQQEFYIFECKFCGDKFSTSNKKQKFCSSGCFFNYLHREYDNRKTYCFICSNKFKPKNEEDICCSPECYKQMEIIKRNRKSKSGGLCTEYLCLSCGYKVIVEPNERYSRCRKCDSMNLSNFIGYRNICLYCGEVFVSYYECFPYCSIECKALGKTGLLYKEATNMQKNSSLKKHIEDKVIDLIERGKQKGNCFNNHTINYWDFSFTDYHKEKALKRDKYTCQICGRKTNLEVHHVIKRQNGGNHELSNLITLCKKCHRHIETGDIKNATDKCFKNYMNVIKNGDDIPITISKKKIVEYEELLNKIFKILKNIDSTEIRDILIEIDDFLEN